MAIGTLAITETDIVAGQKVFSSTELARIAQIEAWANDEVKAKAVDLSSAQTISGAKNFTGIATLAKGSLSGSSDAPTTDAMIANKKYVDDEISSAVVGAGFVKTSTTSFVVTVAAGAEFEDLDISSAIGTNAALVYFEIKSGNSDMFVRPKGTGGAYSAYVYTGSGAFNFNGANQYAQGTVMSDSSGVIQVATTNTYSFTLKILGYVK